MRRIPAIVRMPVYILTLVLATLQCRAEGLVFQEQRDAFEGAFLPALQANPTQVVVDLAGTWEFRSSESALNGTTWMPGSFWGDVNDVEFRRTFVLPESLRTWNFQLHLPEIRHRVQVWLNGQMASTPTGNHIGFWCVLERDLLKYESENELVLRVSKRLSATSTLPLRPQLLHPRNYGGVVSGIYLRGVRSWAIEDARLEVSEGRDVNVAVHVARYGPPSHRSDSLTEGARVQIAATLQDTAGRVVAESVYKLPEPVAAEQLSVSLRLPNFDRALWSPEAPVLYTLSVALLADGDTIHHYERRAGFKQLEVRSGDFYLNGERLRIQGMDYIPEHPGGGRAISVAQLERDVRSMKELGINLVRVPFSAPPPALIDIAERQGVLLLVEAGVDGVPSAFTVNEKFRDHCSQVYERLAELYADRVAVMAWGIGSQMDLSDPAVIDFVNGLRAAMKRWDGRPCYVESASIVSEMSADFVLASAPSGSLWMGPHFPNRADIPIIVSRIGRPATPGDPEQRFLSRGLVNQANYLAGMVSLARADETLDGTLIHAFADYHGASSLLAQPNVSNPYLLSYGIVDSDRGERVAYSRLREVLQAGTTASPEPVGEEGGSPLAFPATGLAALLIVMAAMRRNNVFRHNLRRVFFHPHGFHMDLRYRRFLHTAQLLLVWLLEGLTVALVFVSILFAFRNNLVLDHYLTHFLVPAGLKAGLVGLVWNPMKAVLFLTAVFLVLIILLAVLVRVTSIAFRGRMDLWQAVNYVVWSFAALLFLLPVGTVLYRLLETDTMKWPALGLIALAIIWSVQRLLSALRVGLGTSVWRVYLVAIVVGGTVLLGGAALLNSELDTFAYVNHFHRVLSVR